MPSKLSNIIAADWVPWAALQAHALAGATFNQMIFPD